MKYDLVQTFNGLKFDNVCGVSLNNCSDDFETIFDDLKESI